MTEKRFTSQRTDDYNFSDILDDGKWIGICHVDCEDDFVDKLNELADENLQWKEENKKLKEKIQLLQGELNADAKQYKIFIDIIDEADDLICSHLSKHYQRKWRTFCKNKEYDFE